MSERAPRVTLSDPMLSTVYDAIHEPIMQQRIKLLRREHISTLTDTEREAVDRMLHDLVQDIYEWVHDALHRNVPARAGSTEDETEKDE